MQALPYLLPVGARHAAVFTAAVFTVSVLLFVVPPPAASAQWSTFDPLQPKPPPRVDAPQWSDPIDAFIYARLAKTGLSPSPPVGRRVWLRRATFDLIGLPPEPEAMRRFLADPRPDRLAKEGAVDLLLASPRYGERWGRHWLDVVRYADSDGFAIDKERLSTWRYRDYVIRSFNNDVPFDEMIREQIAGDELKLGERGKIGITFYRLGPWEADNMTKEYRRQDFLNEVTDTVGSAFLGLTVGCAKCHDHKFDPILQADYYKLQAFFTPIQHVRFEAKFQPGEFTTAMQRRLDQAVADRQGKIRKLREVLRKKIADAKKAEAAKQTDTAEQVNGDSQVSSDTKVVDAQNADAQNADAKNADAPTVTDAELDAAIKDVAKPITKQEVELLKKLKTAPEHLMPEQRFEAQVDAIKNPTEDQELPQTFVLANGDAFDPGDKVFPGFPSAAPSIGDFSEKAEASSSDRSGRRSLLAAWLTDPKNPLTTRVLANRVWHYHFGRGIVATPNDFGENGAQPSHPQLLDYLARRLIQHGWRLKPLHREILLSRTYAASIHHHDAERCLAADPENRLYWRGEPRRLEAETIRDAALMVSGRIRFEMGGPGFHEQLPEGMGSSFPFFKWLPSSENQRRRRSIYMFQRRNLVHPLIETFDGADLNASCERRQPSVTAPQALAMFNGRLMHENAMHLAQRVCASVEDADRRIDELYWRVLSREPTGDERGKILAFWASQTASYERGVKTAGEKTAGEEKATDDASLLAFRDLCLAMLNTTEFIYLD